MDEQSDTNRTSSSHNEEKPKSSDLSVNRETISSNVGSNLPAIVDGSAAAWRSPPPVVLPGGFSNSSTISTSGHASETAVAPINQELQQLNVSHVAAPPLRPPASHPFNTRSAAGVDRTPRQRHYSELRWKSDPITLLDHSVHPEVPSDPEIPGDSINNESAPPSAQHKRSASAPIPVAALVQTIQQQQQPQPPTSLLVATPSIINSVQPRQAIQPAAVQPNFQNDHDISEQSPQGRYVRFVEKLGSGAYKDVYRAYDTIEGIEVAWNQVNLSGLPKGDKARIINEVRLLERLHHANIISFHGSWVNREKEQVIFVTEMLSSGTLKSFINKVKVIRWKIAKRWAIQILKGLEYLHSQDPPIIHRDLKCDNIFINGATGDLRIGDLGLSTVISRKTKVLSVLGTPEFMAPELYDENYDEKVDIYAFGMCLLEIFTKEVPYRECRNPAQIYKKVTNHIAPASLSRVKSKEARDFIILCLGTLNNQTGEYVRPSASELLRHPFLDKKPDDESEVEICPPVPETVVENSGDAATNSYEELESSMGSFRQISGEALRGASADAQPRISATSSTIPEASTCDISEDDDDLDHLSSMPITEENMRKVKVLMGRGQNIEDDVPVTPTVVDFSAPSSGSNPIHDQSSNISIEQPSSVSLPPPAATTALHYPVAAYGAGEIEKDVLKLNITLPYKGKTSNVQFDFHLIQDDPVQVTREMVIELGIPESAVLQISEAISGLARDARIKQENEKKAQKQQSVSAAPKFQTPQAPQSGQLLHQTQLVETPLVEVPLTQQLPDISPTLPLPKQVQGVQQNIPTNKPSSSEVLYQQQLPIASPQPPLPKQVQGVQHSIPTNKPPLSEVLHPHLPNVSPTPPLPKQAQGVQQNNPTNKSPPSEILHPQETLNSSTSPPFPPPKQLVTNPQIIHPAQPSPIVANGGVAIQQSKDVNKESIIESRGVDATALAPPQHSKPVADFMALPSLNFSCPEALSLDEPTTLRSVKSAGAVPSMTTLRITSSDDDSSYVSTEENLEELRRIEEEYQKSLQRAKKVYDSRMENLQRSLNEREAQHLQNLMKHEKERAEFEKKVKLAEAEQAKRLQELEEKCRQQKAELLKNKPKSNGLKRSSSSIIGMEAENMNPITKTSSSYTEISGIMR
jgi:WNK lysine deficient protein kinase